MRIIIAILVLGIFWANNADAFNRWPRADNEVNATLGEYRSNHFHGGIDMPGHNLGTVCAVEAGTVTVHARGVRGYGNTIVIAHSNGQATLYAHLHNDGFINNPLCKKNDVVAAGQPIAKVGRTGGNWGPHLHFEVKNTLATNWNTYVSANHLNPLQYLPTPTPQDTTAPTLLNAVIIPIGEGSRAGTSGETKGSTPVYRSLPSINPQDPYGNAPRVVVSGTIRELLNAYDVVNDGGRQGVYQLYRTIYKLPENKALATYTVKFDEIARAADYYDEEWVYSTGVDTHTTRYRSYIGNSSRYYYKLYKVGVGTAPANISIEEAEDILEDNGNWNTKKSRTGPGNATSNADALTPDGWYRIHYQAADHNCSDPPGIGNTKDGYLSCIVDNFLQTVIPTTLQGIPTPTFNQGETIHIKGSGYATNTRYNIYITSNATWTNGMAIPAPVRSAITTTDQNGWIATGTAIGSLPAGNYDLIVDYDNDGIYTIYKCKI